MRKISIAVAIISGSLLVAACGETNKAGSESQNAMSSMDAGNAIVAESETAGTDAPTMGNESAAGDPTNATANSTGEAETAGSNGGPGLKAH